MTSCLVSRSISSMRAISHLPFFQISLAALLGITPRMACASQAWASISNQMRKRDSGSQMAVIWGRE